MNNTRGRALRTLDPSLPYIVCMFHAGTFPSKEVGADGAEIPVEHPIVQTLARTYTEVTGRPPFSAAGPVALTPAT